MVLAGFSDVGRVAGAGTFVAKSADARISYPIVRGSLSRIGDGYAAAMLFGIGFGLIGALLFFFREVLKSAITIILQSIPIDHLSAAVSDTDRFR